MSIDTITNLFLQVPAVAYATLAVVVILAASIPMTLWQFAKRVRYITVTSRRRTTVHVDLEPEMVRLPALDLDTLHESSDRHVS